MVRLSLLCFAAILCLVPARARAEATPRLPFYVATRGDVTIYLLGALHVGAPDDYPQGAPFRPAIAAALAVSPTLAFELSPDDLVAS